MNSLIENLNQQGGSFLNFGWSMLWQSSLLIAVLFVFDFLFRRKVRASIRYALWLVVFVKLCVSPTFALPTSPAWWLHKVPPPIAAKAKPHYTVTFDNGPLPETPQAPLPVFVPPRPAMTLAAWLLVASTSVSLALLGWLLVRWGQITRQIRRAKPSKRLAELSGEAQTFIGTKFKVQVKLTTNSMSPAVCGLVRPAILIPQSLVEHFSDEQLRSVLLHELIHLRRRDVWLNFLQTLLQITYWWHPLVWLANARIRRVREEAVDDAVMLALRDEAETYAPTLLEVAKLALNRPLVSLGLVGIMESRHALRQRIERLVDFRPPRQAGPTLVSLLGILTFTAVAVPMGEGPQQAAKPKAVTNTKANTHWPDQNFEGYRAINLMAQFLIIDESALRSQVPALKESQKPTLHSADETDALLGLLKFSGAKNFNGYEDGLCQPAYSGTFQRYQIGGATNIGGSVTILTTNWGGNFSNMISGYEISMPATQPKWTPMDFNLRPLTEGDGIRCDMDLEFRGVAGGRQTSQITIPNGSAMIWVAKSPAVPGKCQIVLLMPWEQSDSHQRVPFLKRTYKTSQTALYSTWKEQGGKTDEQTSPEFILDCLIHNAGMNFLPPRHFDFNTNGLIEVYATKRDLDQIEKLLHGVNAQEASVKRKSINQETNSVTPQIHIKARFLEVPKGTLAGLENVISVTNQAIQSNQVAGWVGILTDKNFKTVLHNLEALPSVETLAEPEVVTTSGRQTEMRATTLQTIVTNFAFQETSTNTAIVPQTERIEAGPVLGVVPYVLSDGYTINLTVIPSLVEFLGYNQPPDEHLSKFETRFDTRVQLPVVLPSFRIRQTITTLNLWDGQTAIICGLPEKDYVGGTETFEKSKAGSTELMIFITATIVDLAGNRVHADNEIPSAKDRIPPQPQRVK